MSYIRRIFYLSHWIITKQYFHLLHSILNEGKIYKKAIIIHWKILQSIFFVQNNYKSSFQSHTSNEVKTVDSHRALAGCVERCDVCCHMTLTCTNCYALICAVTYLVCFLGWPFVHRTELGHVFFDESLRFRSYWISDDKFLDGAAMFQFFQHYEVC